MSILLALAAMFGRLSLLAVGGINSTIAEIAKQTVQIHHWATPQQFSQLFAIAQAAPGPNMLIVTLIGEHVAGIAGGLVATAAILAPAAVLVIIVARVWERFREARWRRVVQAALLPITVGLVLAAAYVLVRQADRRWLTVAVTVITTAVSLRTRLHPLWMLGAGAVAGLVLA